MKITGLLILLLLCFCNALAQYEHVLVYFKQDQSESNKKEMSRLYSQHLEFIETLKYDGYLTAYGTFKDGNGVAIFVTSDIKDVRSLVQKNPLIISGAFQADYFHTDLRLGEFCLTADEEMKKYNFIKYTSHITKYNVQYVPQLLKMHDDYIKRISKTGNVLVEGVSQ